MGSRARDIAKLFGVGILKTDVGTGRVSVGNAVYSTDSSISGSALSDASIANLNDVNLTVDPEVLEIQTVAGGAGQNVPWLWYENDGDTSNIANNFAGVSELQNVPSSYLGTGNAFFPAVGFYGCSNNASAAYGSSTTSNYHDYFAHSVHGSFNDGDASASDYVNASNVQYTGSGNATIDNAPIQFGPYYYYNSNMTDNSNYNYKTIFNASGEKVGSLTPAFYFNPYRGIPFTTLAGFYYYEPFNRAENLHTSLPSRTRQSEVIYADNGDKYTLQYQPGQFGIRAFRSE